MARKIRASAPKPTQQPPQPVTVRVDPTTPSRRRAERRMQPPDRLIDLPPIVQWPVHLRGCREGAVRIAYTMAEGQWERLHVEPGGGICVR